MSLMTVNDELQQMSELLTAKDEELAFLRRDKTEALTIRVRDNTHQWYVTILEKDLSHGY